MRIIMCGGRDYTDSATIDTVVRAIAGPGATVGAVVYPGGRMEPGWLDGQGE